MRYAPRALAVVSMIAIAALLCCRFLPADSSPPPATSRSPAAATQPTSRSDATTQSSEIRRAHFFVTGRVQAVGFRAFTFDHARKLKLTGWVKNLADGRVEGIAEGPADRVEKLLAAVKVGPAGARVEGLEVKDEKPTGEFKTFTYIH